MTARNVCNLTVIRRLQVALPEFNGVASCIVYWTNQVRRYAISIVDINTQSRVCSARLDREFVCIVYDVGMDMITTFKLFSFNEITYLFHMISPANFHRK